MNTQSINLNTHTDEALILIVDDIARNLQVLGSILSENGFGVSVASSGQGALDAIATQTPDVILLDIQMPDMDGFEVCRRLKLMPATSAIPVIFLTARTETCSRSERDIDASAANLEEPQAREGRRALGGHAIEPIGQRRAPRRPVGCMGLDVLAAPVPQRDESGNGRREP